MTVMITIIKINKTKQRQECNCCGCPFGSLKSNVRLTKTNHTAVLVMEWEWVIKQILYVKSYNIFISLVMFVLIGVRRSEKRCWDKPFGFGVHTVPTAAFASKLISRSKRSNRLIEVCCYSYATIFLRCTFIGATNVWNLGRGQKRPNSNKAFL